MIYQMCDSEAGREGNSCLLFFVLSLILLIIVVLLERVLNSIIVNGRIVAIGLTISLGDSATRLQKTRFSFQAYFCI